MPKFMLMFNASDDDAWENASKADREAAYAEIGRWWSEHSQAGRIVGGEELHHRRTAKTVRFEAKSTKPVVTDGPYLETKDLIGGYAIVEAPDIDTAVEIAKTWPGALMAAAGGVRSSVEVRPIVEN